MTVFWKRINVARAASPSYLLTAFFLVYTCALFAQFPPAAGEEGTTAIPHNSTQFINWAKTCEVERGWRDIRDETLGKVISGNEINATQVADNATISLGDGGVAMLTFDPAIKDGEGFDFAVFENSFSATFLELAFVEVSSDGENYVRFPATSLTQTNEPVGSFGAIEATQIDNLAGKYQSLFGTPFDLSELADSPNLDINAITHIKIIDVVGSLEDAYATYDQDNQAINDPFPTAFPSGGFDLDAIGVINDNSEVNIVEIEADLPVIIFKNQLTRGEELSWQCAEKVEQIECYNMRGERLAIFANDAQILAPDALGMYVLVFVLEGKRERRKVFVY